MSDLLRKNQHVRGWLLFAFGCALIASGLSGCSGTSNRMLPAPSGNIAASATSVAVAKLPQPFDGTSMQAVRGVLPIPASALVPIAHINPTRYAGDTAARDSENTADADGGGQSGFVINPGLPSGDGGIYVAMTAYDDAWVTTPTDGYYNTVNAPTTHGPNGNCIETVTNYYNGFGTPGTTVDQVQFYDFCANNGQGAFAGAIPMDANFIRDYVRVYADSARPLPRYISVVEYSAADKRYHDYLYNASLQQYVDFYDSPAGATTSANGSEGWSIYETHYHGGDCTALPDASEESIQVHTSTGWRILTGSQVFSYMWGSCFSAPFTAPYNAPTFSTSPSVAWTVLSPVAPALSAYARTIVAAAPLAYYRLGDTGSAAVDSSGSNFTGTYGANVKRGVPSLLASEASNTAASFPGGSAVAASVVNVSASTKLQPATAVSVEAWVQESVPSTGTSDLVAYGSMATGIAYTLQVLSNNTVCAFVSTAHGYGLVTGKTALSVGHPYLLSLTYDGTTLSLYVDGSLDGSSPTSGAISYATPGATNGLSIGAAGNSTRPVFAGTIDEVAVFGSALTATTIAAHWTAGSGIAPVPSTPQYTTIVSADAPLAFYPLDDQTTTAVDFGPNKINAAYGAGIGRDVLGLVSSEPTDTAASFPGGTSGYGTSITTARNAKLEPPKTISLETWIQTSAYNASTIDLISYGPEMLGQPYTLQLSSNGTIGMFATTVGGYALVKGVTPLTLNAPHLIDGTYDGSTMRLYVDGVLDATAAASGALNYSKVSSTYGLSLGTAYDTYRPAFKGTLQNVAVFGTALSAARIADHWTAGSGHVVGP
jgi:hypothetical protein